jgi:hypothetical protein
MGARTEQDRLPPGKARYPGSRKHLVRRPDRRLRVDLPGRFDALGSTSGRPRLDSPGSAATETPPPISDPRP